MYTAAIIGTGQLGSRHLQALAKSSFSVRVEVVDPSNRSLKTAKRRFEEMPLNKNIDGVDYFTSLDSLSSKIDLCIIATTSDTRAKVTRELLQKREVGYILFEKVLFQSIPEYEEISKLLKRYNVRSWVNCPRRIYPFYQHLKKILAEDERIFFTTYGGEWGLACNSIHLIDLVAFLTGSSEYSVEANTLDSDAIDSKREGFIELTGTLRGFFSNGGEFLFHSCRGSLAPMIITICGRNAEVMIDEERGTAKIAQEHNNWKWEDVKFSVPFQSDLTQNVAKDILENGDCGLTPFFESVNLHLPLLKAIMEHLSSIRDEKIEFCPIT